MRFSERMKHTALPWICALLVASMVCGVALFYVDAEFLTTDAYGGGGAVGLATLVSLVSTVFRLNANALVMLLFALFCYQTPSARASFAVIFLVSTIFRMRNLVRYIVEVIGGSQTTALVTVKQAIMVAVPLLLFLACFIKLPSPRIPQAAVAVLALVIAAWAFLPLVSLELTASDWTLWLAVGLSALCTLTYYGAVILMIPATVKRDEKLPERC